MPDSCHVVAIGGGGGATQALQAAHSFASRLTAVIAVTDTGRSTGLARAIGNIPAPGDIRATISAFAGDRLIADLLQYRFNGAGIPQLEGMAFGNLMIAALAQVTGDFATAVEILGQLARSTAQVLPVSSANATLCAELADGSMVEGELAVRGLNKPPIVRLFLREPAPAFASVLKAIQEADLVVLGPGSLFTTLLASLLFDGIAEALRTTPGRVVYICNTTTQSGQTDGYRAIDHIQRVIELLGPGVVDTALINSSPVDPQALLPYESDGIFLLQPDEGEIGAIVASGVQPIVRNLAEPIGPRRALWNKQDTVRHDPLALRNALYEAAFGE